jgi:hypothetical protein
MELETGSSLFVISIFLLGAACGALLTSIHRQARLERIKMELAGELSELSRQASARPAAPGISHVPDE